MTKFTAKFTLEKETPGTFRFQEVGANGQPLQRKDAKVGTIYIPKATLGGQACQTLEGVFTAK